jgi:type II secretory pathway component GspD/PulD (secretin)
VLDSQSCLPLRRTAAGYCRLFAIVCCPAFFVAAIAASDEPQSGEFKAYALRHARAQEVEPIVSQALASIRGEHELLVDTKRNRVLVRGPAEAQTAAGELIRSLDKISQRLGSAEKTGGAPAVPVTVLGQSQARQSEIDTVTVPLERLSVADMTATLTNLWGRKLSPLATANKDVTSYLVAFPDRGQLEVHLHRHPRQVVIRGPVEVAGRCGRLIQALDADGGAAERSTRVVPLRGAASPFVRQALLAVKSPGKRLAVRQNAGGGMARGSLPRGTGALLARMFQPKRDEDDAERPADASEGQDATDMADDEDMTDDEDAALSGPVEIEQLEGLDAIIVRGSQRDVERVMRLVEEIERLSLETEPVVEVHHLRHVDSDAMADVIGPLYNDELAPRQGRVSITALVRPNALLLIGRKESVQGMIDLVTRLDQPGGPTSQFDVFRLRNATASLAATTLSQFFAGAATGLGPRVNVTADGRTNTLIVQASPRDLVEAARLIKRLDVASSASVNDVRVFRLRRAAAVDVANMLNAALQVSDGAAAGAQPAPAAASPQGGQQGQQRGAGQGGQGGQGPAQGPQPQVQPQAATAGTSGAAQQAKSLMLRFLSIDGQGQRQINSGSLGDVRITSDAKSNSLVVSAPADSMELIAALIEQLDQVESAPAQIKVFTVVNGDATSMANMLEELFQTGGSAAGQAGGQGQQGFQGPVAPQPVTTGEGGPVPLRFSVDARTNSIIASGSASDLIVVEAILLRLDDSDVRERQSIVYKLKNAPALDVALAINDYLQKERQTTQTTPGLMSPFEKIEREVVVVPEIVTNSLIVSATPRFFREIEKIVQDLDARAAMVMIQVLIAQVQLTNYDEFGVEAGLQSSVLFDRSLLSGFQTITNTSFVPAANGGSNQLQQQVIVGANTTPGFDFNNGQLVGAAPAGSTTAGPIVGLTLPNSGSSTSLTTAPVLGYQGLSNFALGRSNSNLGYGGLVLSLSSNTVNFLLRALRERDRIEVLSRPQIMTLDNQPAFIQVGQRVPLVGNTTVGVVGSTTGVQYTNVGLIVAVTPRITPDGLVVMEIDAERSQLGPITSGVPVGFGTGGQVIRQPVIDVTLAQTTISALDGQTVVFGGLITKNTQTIQRRVPGISEIPLVGRLFRYDFKQQQRTELLIIMTPRVIRNNRDADDIKLAEAARMSWCMADVQKIHGDGGLRNRTDDWSDAETPTVYPDRDAGGAPNGAELIVPPMQEDGARMAPPRQGPRFAPANAPISPAGYRDQPGSPAVVRLPQPTARPAPRSADGNSAPSNQLHIRPAAPPARRSAPPRIPLGPNAPQQASDERSPTPLDAYRPPAAQPPAGGSRVRRAGYLAERASKNASSDPSSSEVQPAAYDVPR